MTVIEGSLWIAYLAGWESAGNCFRDLDEEDKKRIIAAFRAWLLKTTTC